MELKKECLICKTVFTKDKRTSKKHWFTKTKYCSQQCVSRDKKILANRKLGIIKSYERGRAVWNKGIKTGLTPWNKGKGEYARKLGFGKWMIGKKASLESRRKNSEAMKKRIAEGKHNFYIDGRTPKNVKIRHSIEYRLWRESVFKRDNWTCQWCGVRSGNGKKVILHADHIKPFAYFPDLRLELSNGRTLCRSCHAKTDTYKGKAINFKP